MLGVEPCRRPARSATEDFGEQLILAALEGYERLDGLINNAGLHYERLPWEENEIELHRMV